MNNDVSFYILLALFILAFVSLLGYLYKKGHRKIMCQILLGLVVQAEKELGSGTGELKYAYVVNKLYEHFPTWLTSIYTKKELDHMIEDAVKKLKEVLQKGTTLTGYDDEEFLKITQR